jgi:hypothetical protein
VTKPFDGAVKASPSMTIPGGTVYTFADGTSVVVSGGTSAAYRANSPGLDLGDPKHSKLTDPRFQASITSKIQHYGAIGYTISTGGRVQLVFSDATAAARAMRNRLDSINDANPGSGEAVYLAYNGGGNLHESKLLHSVFKGRGQENLLKAAYGDLNPAQKETFVSLAMQSEGFNNGAGATAAPTTQQADPNSFAVTGWMLGLPVGGLKRPVVVNDMPGDTFNVSADGNTLTINTASGPIVYRTGPDGKEVTVSIGGTSVPIDGRNLQSISDTPEGVKLQFPSSSSTIKWKRPTTGSLSPVDKSIPIGDVNSLSTKEDGQQGGATPPGFTLSQATQRLVVEATSLERRIGEQARHAATIIMGEVPPAKQLAALWGGPDMALLDSILPHLPPLTGSLFGAASADLKVAIPPPKAEPARPRIVAMVGNRIVGVIEGSEEEASDKHDPGNDADHRGADSHYFPTVA